MEYDLSHLTQGPQQWVLGPIQDDEALLLFALCRSMIIKNVVEVGTQSGYSTKNFIKAVGDGGHVISVDPQPFGENYSNFTFIQKNIRDVEVTEIPWSIDLLFFDSHDESAQIAFFDKMQLADKINNDTVIAIHDTNLHPPGISSGITTEQGCIHQLAERNLVNKLIDSGWSPFHVHTKLERHNESLPFRHGLTLLNKKTHLKTK
jgi:predicted O-methyltransferase YrrM